MTVKGLNGAIRSANALVRLYAQLAIVFTTNGWIRKEKECAHQAQRKKIAGDKDTAIGREGARERVIAHSIHICRCHQIKLSNQFAIKFLQTIQIQFKELCVKHVQKLDCTQKKETYVKDSALMVNAHSLSKLKKKSINVLIPPLRNSETTSKRLKMILKWKRKKPRKK